MNIAIYHNIPDGGAKRAFYHLAMHLVEYGHELDLYTFDVEQEQCFRLSPYARKVYSKKSPLLPIVKRGHPLIANNRNIYRQFKNIQRINRFSQKFATLINTGGYDVAIVTHCQHFQSPNILRFLTIPTIYYCQEPFRRFYEPLVGFNPISDSESMPTTTPRRRNVPIFLLKIAGISYGISQSLLKRNDQQNVQAATRILTNSYYSRESIYRVYGKFAQVNYLGVDTKHFRPMPDVPKENMILAVGRYYPIKQHHFILHSLAKLPKNGRPDMVIIGNDVPDVAYQEYLQRLANHFQITLRMFNNISDQELVVWYNRARIVAFPPILEPFGLVPLEAMACQTPVVGIREGGIRETIVDGVTGILTERDETEFAEALKLLFQNERLCQQFGEQGRVHVTKHWTWEQSVAQLNRHLSAVLHHT